MRPVKWILLLLLLLGGVMFLLHLKTAPAGLPDSVPRVAEVAHSESEAEGQKPAAAPALPPVKAAVPQMEAVPGVRLENHLLVTVRDESGQPLPAATVASTYRGAQRRPVLTNSSRSFPTSAQGVADVSWPPEGFEQLELLVSKDEFGPRRMMWDLKTGDQIPARYEIKLTRGVRIGGVVVDPEGSPVAGATVALSRFWRGGENMQTKGEEPEFPTQRQISGPDGRWAARNLPAALLERISVTGSHSNFVEVRVSMDGNAAIEQELREERHVLTLKRGNDVRGRVLSMEEKPIGEAQVWAGRRYSRDRQQTKSDAEGRFIFRKVGEGKVDFSAMAAGFSPTNLVQTVGPVTPEVVIHLDSGGVIRGTVLDEKKLPVEGVHVALEGGMGDPSYDRYEFSATTDSEGRFEWNGAPKFPQQFYFGKQGYQQKRGLLLKPEVENTIVLKHSREILGRVVDAETGKAVTRFSIGIGQFQGNRVLVQSRGRKEFTSPDGSFTMNSEEENENGIEATARGYADFSQRLSASAPEGGGLLVKLKPSTPLSGIVVSQDGRPAAGATVSIVDESLGGRAVEFSRGKIRNSNPTSSKSAVTDEEGRFEIAGPPETGRLVAADGAAFASVTLAEFKLSGTLVLQSLGRIEGVLRRGTETGAGQEMSLDMSKSGIYFNFESTIHTTDAEGRFAFENVPAGTVSIVRLVRVSANSRSLSHSIPVVVQPGQTTQVVLGGSDATLHGMVKFENPPGEEVVVSAQLMTSMPDIPVGLTPAERGAFFGSEEWKELMKNRKSYSATVAGDGSMMLDSVLPGRYTLTVSAYKMGDEFQSRAMAAGTSTVVVPEGAHPGQPIPVGEIILKSPRPPGK